MPCSKLERLLSLWRVHGRLDRIRESKVPYAITNFPSGGYPFAGTQGFFINAQSQNVLLAQTFLNEFIANEDTMLKLYDVGKRPPPICLRWRKSPILILLLSRRLVKRQI